MFDATHLHTYTRATSVVFFKTKEAFGGLSNMAGGYPLLINGLRILTSEALYQACRYPNLSEVQRLIIAQASPMSAKMKAKPYRHQSRPDWEELHLQIMQWCVRVKLAQHRVQFGNLLLSTTDRPIVEETPRGDYWGAKPIDQQSLIGRNVMGQILMALREELRTGQFDPLTTIEPPPIPDFLLDGIPIEAISIGLPHEA